MNESSVEAKMKLKKAVLVELLLLLALAVYLVFKSSTNVFVDLQEMSSSQEVSLDLWRALGIEPTLNQFIDIYNGELELDDVQAYRSNLLIKHQFDKKYLKVEPIKFNVNKSDVIVVLHIQKTGGTTFETFLAHHTNVMPPCRCTFMEFDHKRDVCACLNDKGQDWMVNRHSTGWVCGVHADFTDMTNCIDQWFNSQDNEKRKRSYHYVTLVRDPVTRFISEWLHVRRGATWKESRLHCDGRDASLEEVPFCFRHGSWADVSFEEFINCTANMAFNRQTRMLANLSLSDCYRINSTKTQTERNEIMLQSAKDNLRKFFKFFALLEYVEEGQALFEKTFQGLMFTRNMSCKKYSAATNYAVLSERHWNIIVEKNMLDVRLYQFAKDLFFQRLDEMNIPLQPRNHDSQVVAEGLKYSVVTM